MNKTNKKDFSMSYGEYLKNLRKDAHLSQSYIAQKIGVSRPTYLLIEKERRELNISEAKKAANLFNLSIDDFLSRMKPLEVSIEKKQQTKNKVVLKERISVPQERVDKFIEVLLYIVKKVGAKPNVGEAVLCKLLYFIDFDYYEKFEEQFIGARYIKNHYGPTPIEFINIVKAMEDQGDLVKIPGKYFDYDQKKYLPLRDPDMSLLTSEEVETMDKVLDRLSDKSAAEMRDYSHGDVPWITAKDGKFIDYESVFYRTPAYSVRSYGDAV